MARANNCHLHAVASLFWGRWLLEERFLLQINRHAVVTSTQLGIRGAKCDGQCGDSAAHIDGHREISELDDRRDLQRVVSYQRTGRGYTLPGSGLGKAPAAGDDVRNLSVAEATGETLVEMRVARQDGVRPEARFLAGRVNVLG